MTSVTAWMLCKIMKTIGLPDGVVNMVFGYGSTVGESIVTNPQVKIVSFTGSTQVYGCTFFNIHVYCRFLLKTPTILPGG